jgi:hypothetical protein
VPKLELHRNDAQERPSRSSAALTSEARQHWVQVLAAPEEGCARIGKTGHFASVSIANHDDAFDPSGTVPPTPLWRGHRMVVRFDGLVGNRLENVRIQGSRARPKDSPSWFTHFAHRHRGMLLQPWYPWYPGYRPPMRSAPVPDRRTMSGECSPLPLASIVTIDCTPRRRPVLHPLM